MARQENWATLSAGQHLSSEDGLCLMELVSIAAHERWSDHPCCTHPLLAHLARRVNDVTSDLKRAELAGLVPTLVWANTDDPQAYARIAAECTRVALAHRPTLVLRGLHDAAVRRSRPGDSRRHLLYRRGAAFRSVDLAVLAVQLCPQDVADAALRRMLSSAVHCVGAAEPFPVVQSGMTWGRGAVVGDRTRER
jgi:hypothetical protein